MSYFVNCIKWMKSSYTFDNIEFFGYKKIFKKSYNNLVWMFVLGYWWFCISSLVDSQQASSVGRVVKIRITGDNNNSKVLVTAMVMPMLAERLLSLTTVPSCLFALLCYNKVIGQIWA